MISISRFRDKLRGSAGWGEGVFSFAPFICKYFAGYFWKSTLTFSHFCSSRSLRTNSQVLTAKSKKF